MSDPSDADDPPISKEEAVTLSEQVNITTSPVLQYLRAPVVPQAPLKKIVVKRKIPHTTVTFQEHLNNTPHPDVIDLKDLVVDAQVKSANQVNGFPSLL